jgi:hypothetical protein
MGQQHAGVATAFRAGHLHCAKVFNGDVAECDLGARRCRSRTGARKNENFIVRFGVVKWLVAWESMGQIGRPRCAGDRRPTDCAVTGGRGEQSGAGRGDASPYEFSSTESRAFLSAWNTLTTLGIDVLHMVLIPPGSGVPQEADRTFMN